MYFSSHLNSSSTKKEKDENDTENEEEEEEEEDDDEQDEDDDDDDSDGIYAKLLGRPIYKPPVDTNYRPSTTPCKIFFKRSDSTLMLGREPSDPFSTPLKEALPLADRPHLLNPSARRDHLFGVKKTKEDGGSETSQNEPLTMKLDSGKNCTRN